MVIAKAIKKPINQLIFIPQTHQESGSKIGGIAEPPVYHKNRFNLQKQAVYLLDVCKALKLCRTAMLRHTSVE
jgi:hypothetical protein